VSVSWSKFIFFLAFVFFDFTFLRLEGIFSQAVKNAGDAVTSFAFVFIDFFAVGMSQLRSFEKKRPKLRS